MLNETSSRVPSDLIHAYGAWIQNHLQKGWDGYLFGFTFNHVPGPMEAKIQQMYRDVTKVYGRLATRSVRKTRSPAWARLLPKGLFLPDFPVPKREKQLLRDVIVNDGLHVHGVVLANRWGRIDQPLDIHFSKNQQTYLLGNIRHIEVERISELPSYVTEYAIKALKRGRITSDHILILPRNLSELPDQISCRSRC